MSPEQRRRPHLLRDLGAPARLLPGRIQRTLALLLLVALPAACTSEPAPEGGTSDDAGTAAAPATTGAADADPSAAQHPPLVVIMQGLQEDMDRVAHGLWSENWGLVRQAATDIAEHPTVSPEERARISEVLGEQMPAFAAMDRDVHDASVALAEHAGRGDVDNVLESLETLQNGCVACHLAFRDRLVETAPGG